MSVGFGDDFKEQVRAATNIVDVIGDSLVLTPNGSNYLGICPFHDDKNPSLTSIPIGNLIVVGHARPGETFLRL